MALSGMHIACGYAGAVSGRDQDFPVLGKLAWSQTMATPGTTASAAPGSTGSSGQPLFEFYSSADAYVAIGAAPDATNGPRIFVPAATKVQQYCDPNDKAAWILA